MNIVTYKYRLKDRSARKALAEMASACNRVWNFCSAAQRQTEARYKAGTKPRWLSTYDLHKLTAGTSVELGITATTICEVCRYFIASRDKKRRAPHFRASIGPKRSLGWIPFKADGRIVTTNSITYLGRRYRWFGNKRRPMPSAFRTGAFVEDASGKWWITFQVEATERECGVGEVGIDLGLHSFAALSSGETIAQPQFARRLERKLATAQRAGNRQRARRIHAGVANARRDFLHKLSTALVRENSLIAVGDVDPIKLAKTRFAKSVSDAGWSTFRTMLRYKCQQAKASYVEVNEAFTTQACSDCGVIGGPRSIAGLGIRQWQCSCGATHDRDVNAAKNILAIARRSVAPLAGESRLSGRIGTTELLEEVENQALRIIELENLLKGYREGTNIARATLENGK